MNVDFTSGDAITVREEMLAAYTFNISWYERAARLQRGLHYVIGIGIILGQVATLSSFSFEKQLPAMTSPALAAVTSAFIAIFGYLAPTAKWRDFRTAQFELMAQRLLFRVEMDSATEASHQRAVIEKYVELGMRVINATAASYWRQVTKSAHDLKATDASQSSHSASD